MKLKASSHDDIRELRAAKLRSYRVPLLPEFHAHLAQHAAVHEIRDAQSTVGYALMYSERHGDHSHLTLLEVYLTPPYEDRYEDALALIREELKPNLYLVRSDECFVETSLLAQGFQMEISLAVLVARAALEPPAADHFALKPLDYPDLKAAWEILVHVRGEENVAPLAELQHEVPRDRWWVFRLLDQPVGLVSHEASPGGMYGLLDVLAPYRAEDDRRWALLAAGRLLEQQGLAPAAVVNMRDQAKLDLFRKANYFTAAAYLVFYDPLAGRPSVDVIGRDELWALVQAKEQIRLIDVLGEEHWREEGHLPGSEWIDFRSLSREAKKRYQKDEPLIVYCNDYT